VTDIILILILKAGAKLQKKIHICKFIFTFCYETLDLVQS